MEKRAEWPARGRAAVSPFPGDIVQSFRVLALLFQMNWVCQDSWKVPFIQSIFFMGSICGVQLYGWISDKFGRYPSFFCSNVLLAIFGMCLPLCENLSCFASIRFLMGLNWNTIYTSLLVLCKFGTTARLTGLVIINMWIVIITPYSCPGCGHNQKQNPPNIQQLFLSSEFNLELNLSWS